MPYFPSPMPPHDVATIIFHSITDGLAVLFNCALLLAVIMRSPGTIKSYKILIMNSAIIDLLSSFSMLMSMKLKNIKLSCYFALERRSPFENHERVPTTIVSTNCGGGLKKMDSFLGPSNRKLYGASSDLDIINSRGTGTHSLNEKDLKPIAESLICEEHEKELLTRWSGLKYNHIRTKTQGTHRELLCSFPMFKEQDQDANDDADDTSTTPPYPLHDVNVDPDNKNTKYIVKEEARLFTEATGHHIHLGTPVCEDHHKQILAIIDEYTSLDKDWIMSEEAAVSTTSPIDMIKEAIHSLADALGLTGYLPTKLFNEYAEDTKRKKGDIGYKMYRSILTELAPGHEEALHQLVERRFHPRNWDRQLDHSADALFQTIAEQYMVAPTPRMRDFTLALLAGKYSYGIVLRYIPSLSIYKYQKARRIARSGNFYPVTVHPKLERYDREGVSELIAFITSPLVMMGLPYGQKTVTLSTGEKQTIPNTIRMMSQAEIVRQWPLYMKAIGKEKHILSASSIIRLLNAIPATQTHSMSCVDGFLAKATYAFKDLLTIIDRLNVLRVFDNAEKNDWRHNILEDELYLKNDYKLHLKPESPIANHCMRFGLSDPEDPAFRSVEEHQHPHQCSQCVHLHKTFSELLGVISDASAGSSSDSEKKELAEIHFKVKSHQDTITRLRNHELRSAFANLERERIVSHLTESQCLVTADWATKFLSAHFRKPQSLFFGQSGHSWHVTHTLCMRSGQYVQHSYIHLLNTEHQDSATVTNIFLHVAEQLRKLGITLAHWRSDNGGCYHSAATIGSFPEIMEKTGLRIASYSFSESQNGKSAADRVTAAAKGKIRQYIDMGNNVESSHDMWLALTYLTDLYGVTVYEAIFTPPSTGEENNFKIPNIGDMGHFEFEVANDGKNNHYTTRYFKYNGIGPGKTITTMTPNKGSMEIKNIGSRVLIDDPIVAQDMNRLENNEKTLFWISDPDRSADDEPFDANDESEDTGLPTAKQSLALPDTLHYCWCGSAFIRFQNLLNHLEWGTHKICLETTTMCDYGIKLFQEKIEADQLMASLSPLRDTLSCTVDASVPLLSEGFALRARAHGGALPASSRTFLVNYFEEEKKKGIKPDATQALNWQNLAAEGPFEDRLTFDQIRSLFSRLAKAKTAKKTKRAADDDPMDGSKGQGGDEDKDDYVYGEWEVECDQEEADPWQDPEFVIYRFVHENNSTLFNTNLN